jgi:hypothetical protein
MKLRTTLLVVVVGVIAWLAIKLLGDPPAPPPSRMPLVEAELLGRFEQIDVQLLTGSRFRLERQAGGGIAIRFGIDGDTSEQLPFSDVANLEQVKDLIQALRDSWREPLAGGIDDQLKAGLVSPRFAVTVRAGGQETVLRYGNDDPAGGGILACAGPRGQEQLFRTSRQVANLLDSNLINWRDHRVFPVDPFGVTQIEIVRHPEDPDAPVEVLTAVCGGGMRDWRIVQPRSLMADPEACRALAQQLSLLKIERFVSQKWREGVDTITGLPDQPRWTVTVAAGEQFRVVQIGKNLEGQGYAATCEQRDPNLCFTIPKAALDPILKTPVDSLRPRRLFPRLGTALVSLRCDQPDGTPIWLVEKQEQHENGAWIIQRPFVARANAALGANSFGQVVADLARLEIEEFMPAGTPFTPEAKLGLRWNVGPAFETRSYEIARDGARTLLRDPAQPGELFAVAKGVGAWIDLDLELGRDLVFLPADEWDQRVVRWRLVVAGRETLEVARADSNAVFQAVGSTEASMVPTLTGEAAQVVGKPCLRYVRRARAQAETKEADPFRKVAFELIVDTPDRQQRLVVGGSADSPDGGLYCKLTPALPDDVWLVVPRVTLERLLRLAPQ